MFAKWAIVAERASPGTMSTAGLTRPIAARLRQFGLRPPTFSGDAFPGCFWLTDGGSPSRCNIPQRLTVVGRHVREVANSCGKSLSRDDEHRWADSPNRGAATPIQTPTTHTLWRRF